MATLRLATLLLVLHPASACLVGSDCHQVTATDGPFTKSAWTCTAGCQCEIKREGRFGEPVLVCEGCDLLRRGAPFGVCSAGKVQCQAPFVPLADNNGCVPPAWNVSDALLFILPRAFADEWGLQDPLMNDTRRSRSGSWGPAFQNWLQQHPVEVNFHELPEPASPSAPDCNDFVSQYSSLWLDNSHGPYHRQQGHFTAAVLRVRDNLIEADGSGLAGFQEIYLPPILTGARAPCVPKRTAGADPLVV